MISIQMGGVDVVLGVQWLKSLRILALKFQDVFMRFSLDGKEIKLRGIQGKPSMVKISDIMKKVLNNGHYGVISQLFSLDVQASIYSDPLDLQIAINNYSKAFGEIPNGIPPAQDHYHNFHLQP
jgi:hypothetical protein